LFTICITYIYLDFFIWNIKTLFFFNFSRLTHETRNPTLWPDHPRTGFNNYGYNYSQPHHSTRTISSPYPIITIIIITIITISSSPCIIIILGLAKWRGPLDMGRVGELTMVYLWKTHEKLLAESLCILGISRARRANSIFFYFTMLYFLYFNLPNNIIKNIYKMFYGNILKHFK